jgi:hypothetical protein
MSSPTGTNYTLGHKKVMDLLTTSRQQALAEAEARTIEIFIENREDDIELWKARALSAEKRIADAIRAIGNLG